MAFYFVPYRGSKSASVISYLGVLFLLVAAATSSARSAGFQADSPVLCSDVSKGQAVKAELRHLPFCMRVVLVKVGAAGAPSAGMRATYCRRGMLLLPTCES